MQLSAEEEASCRQLARMALAEDLDDVGDITSHAIIPPDLSGHAVFRSRADGVLAGLPAADVVCKLIDPTLAFQPLLADGSTIRAGDRLAILSGPLRALLAAERTALNFLQRLSGIASLTRRYVDAVAGHRCAILDTRKTTPGWRLLEKYAVRCGGGRNHRMGLFDAILIKDNHLVALGGDCPVSRAVTAARDHVKPGVSITIEVDDLAQFDQALACRPEIILLDNFPIDWLQEAARRRNTNSPAVLLEASGGVSLATVGAIAATGVNRISVGALTHSAPALDIGLDFETNP